MLTAALLYLAVGVVTGILAGLLGVGGGLVIVPSLVFGFRLLEYPDHLIMHLAIGTSLASIIGTSLASIRAHHRRGAVRWPAVARLTPGILAGSLMGAAVAGNLPGTGLRSLFGLFALGVAAQLALDLKPSAHSELPGWPGMTLAGTSIGLISALVGIGGGSMTVPFLAWNRVSMREAVATSAACGLPIALAGALGYWISGAGQTDLPAYSSGYIHWPACLGILATSTLFAGYGAHLAHRLPTATLKRVFALLLAGIGLHLLLG